MRPLNFLFLFAFVITSLLSAKAQVPAKLLGTPFFTTKYTKDKVWDVQRDPAYPETGKDWTLSGLNAALDATGATIDWGAGRYLMFSAEVDKSNNSKSVVDDLYQIGTKYNITLKLFELSGKLVKVVSKNGTIIGIGAQGFMYEEEGQYGTFFATNAVNSKSTITYKPNFNAVSKLSELAKGKEANKQSEVQNTNIDLPFFKTKYTKDKAWDVQRSPAFPTAKQKWTLSGLKAAIDASGATIEWGNGRYLMFVADANIGGSTNVVLDDVLKKGTKYNIALHLYESNGKLVKVVSKWGKIIGMGENGFMYNNEGMYGTFFSVVSVNSASTISYKPNIAEVSKFSELAITANGSTGTISTKPFDLPKKNTENVQKQIASGFYTLTARCSGKLLDVLDASTKDGAAIQQWKKNGNTAQHWKIEPVASAPGYYTLTSRSSGKLLEAVDGAKVQQFKQNGKPSQLWKIEPVASDPTYFILTSKSSGNVLDVLDASTQDGAKIQHWQLNGNIAQHWKLDLTK